jgi:hypothetical protein
MGMHVDHGCFLQMVSGSLRARPVAAKHDCQDRSMATAGQMAHQHRA